MVELKLEFSSHYIEKVKCICHNNQSFSYVSALHPNLRVEIVDFMTLMKSWVNISTSKSHHPGDNTHTHTFITTLATTPAVRNAQFVQRENTQPPQGLGISPSNKHTRLIYCNLYIVWPVTGVVFKKVQFHFGWLSHAPLYSYLLNKSFNSKRSSSSSSVNPSVILCK